MDEQVWANEPYTQQDLANQINWAASSSPDGPQILSDATNYVDGINAYIAKAESPLNALTMLPAEYAAIGQPQGPQPFTVEDLVSIATLVGGIFGNGGGQQLSNAVLYENMKSAFGSEHFTVAGSPELTRSRRRRRRRSQRSTRQGQGASEGQAEEGRPTLRSADGRAGATDRRARRQGRARRRQDLKDHSGFGTFLSFVDPSDPEAPTTVHGKSFPYQTLPRPSKAVQKTLALPDPGSVQYVNPVVAGAVPAGEAGPGHDRIQEPALLGHRARRRRERRPARVPALDVERAAGQRRRQRQRPSARGDGAAGQLLQPRRS